MSMIMLPKLKVLFVALCFSVCRWCAHAARDVGIHGNLTDGVNTPYGVSILEPVPDSTKLQVNQEGLRLLRAMPGHLAPIVVIGPYRSGKSFLINQMLGTSCDSGMVVGHQRTTQTRGVWLWSQPVPAMEALAATGAATHNRTARHDDLNLVFFDTEGFESTGQSGAYDDRVFAFAAIVGSTLLYNLAEAVRESDIAKLSFAVELAQAFYPQYEGPGSSTASRSHSNETAARYLEPLHMVWVIQRDFLQGKSTQASLEEALAPVPNPKDDASISQVNRIRESIKALSHNSIAYGLPQPHLNRTALCELPDSALDAAYLTHRDRLHAHVYSTARAKTLRGAPLGGAGLADLIEALVDALNACELPTSGSMLEAFNEQLLRGCADAHAAALQALPLPLPEARVRREAAAAAKAALARLHRDAFGAVAELLDDKLQRELDRELQATLNRNELQSGRTCSRLETQCEAHIERLAQMALPSLGRFAAKSAACQQAFEQQCVGPAREEQAARLQHALEREKARFQREYNDRLHMGLVAAALVVALLSRFVLKRTLLEVAGWGSFVFLEAYPHVVMGSKTMYESAWWQRLVGAWDLLIYNRFLDLETWWLPLLLLAVLAYAGVRYRHVWLRLRSSGCWLLWPCRRKRKPSKAGRDLEV